MILKSPIANYWGDGVDEETRARWEERFVVWQTRKSIACS